MQNNKLRKISLFLELLDILHKYDANIDTIYGEIWINIEGISCIDLGVNVTNESIKEKIKELLNAN